MFDISALKEMKLSELQEIAKAAKTIKFNGVKKETLISQILELTSEASLASDLLLLNTTDLANLIARGDKPKRARIIPVKKSGSYSKKYSYTHFFLIK